MQDSLRPIDFAAATAAQMAGIIAIYRDAFEAPWEMPVATVADLGRQCAQPGALCRGLALLEGEAPIAIAIAKYLPASRLWYLQYMAVTRTRQNMGLGSGLLHAMARLGETVARTAGHAGCRGTLLEVELVDGPPPNADRTLRQRRAAFYLRHGALRTGATVPRPPGAQPEMPEWEIMLLPGAAWSGAIAAAPRRAVVRALMVEGYGVDPAAPWLARQLAAHAP